MIDLTPLDIRKKKGDLGKVMRGYDPEEVDHFLELVAERMEELVKEGLALRERVARLEAQVKDQEGREKAVHEALVTAQTVRDEIKIQARKEAELIVREAEAAAQAVRDGVARVLDERRGELRDLVRSRARFLKSMRTLLDRQVDALAVEEGSPPPGDFDMEAIGARVAPRPRKEITRPLDSLLEDDSAGTSPAGEVGNEPVDVDSVAALESGDRDRRDP